MRAKLLAFWRREAIERLRPALAKVDRRELFRRWRQSHIERGKAWKTYSALWWVILLQNAAFGIWSLFGSGWISILGAVFFFAITILIIAERLGYFVPTRARMKTDIEAFLRMYCIDGKPSQCATCGYCLDGINEGRLTRCPECGRVQPY